ncbi:MAG TPA: hypothetical protein VGS57_10600 [Thermoanaerobaculia bacterium]|jgi:hypothetical protein|nr:hypothetical protein [Thermoanaerobaculia bacterium]
MDKASPTAAANDLPLPGDPIIVAPTLVAPVQVPRADEAAPAGRQAIVRYVGFRSTTSGREYTMRVNDVQSSRDFVLLISHQAFASHETRFQDAPDLCSSKLRRELSADPGMLPGASIAVTPQDIVDYRNSHLTSTEKRTRVKP